MAAKRKAKKKIEVIPPVRVLKLALVAMVDGRSDEIFAKLRTEGHHYFWPSIADWVLAQSEKQCFFCEAPQTNKLMAFRKLSWDVVPICTCLAELRPKYVEYHLNWQQKLSAIKRELENNRRKPEEIIYSDKCVTPECKQVLVVNTKQIVDGLGPADTYKRKRLCDACAEKQFGKRRPPQQKQESNKAPYVSKQQRPPPGPRMPPGEASQAKMGTDSVLPAVIQETA